MKKMFFAIMVATSLMTASFANAQNEVKKETVTKQQTSVHKVQKGTKQVDKTTKAPATKTKTVSKTEKTTTTK